MASKVEAFLTQCREAGRKFYLAAKEHADVDYGSPFTAAGSETVNLWWASSLTDIDDRAVQRDGKSEWLMGWAQAKVADDVMALPTVQPEEFIGDWLLENRRQPRQFLPGYTTGARWNGWACPYFERSIADEIARQTPYLSYNEATDSYILAAVGDYDEASFKGVDVRVAGTRAVKHVYPIGAGDWTWDVRSDVR